jgi:two-component system CheB/CheR fusion protein
MPVELDADLLRIAQVLSNLLTNAIRYTPAGGRILVRAGLQGDRIVITVSDNGAGIDPTRIAEMFDMFTQAHPDAERKYGLGIGLALVKSIVEMHGGQVSATSAGLGKGSEFTVTLPGARALPAAPAVVAPPAPAVAQPEPGQRGLILIADDNVDAGWGVARLLEIAGFSTVLVHGGADALHEAQLKQPDVGILDIGMPDMSGLEVARALRTTTWGRRMALIAATGWGQESDERASLQAGFDAHMTKPVDLRKLSALVDQLLAERQARAAE